MLQIFEILIIVGRDSSVGTATRYGLDGPGIESRWEARFSAPVQTGPRAHPASYTMGTGSFPGVKWPGRGVDHQPPSSAEVKERVELYLYSLSGPSLPVLGWTYLLTPCRRILLEKLTGSAARQEIPRIFGTRRFLTVLTSARHLSLSWSNSIQSPQPPPISRVNLLYAYVEFGFVNITCHS